MDKIEVSFSSDRVVLDHGHIEVVLGEYGNDFMRSAIIEYHVHYERNDYYLYEHGESNSLDKAIEIYNDLHNKAESKIINGTAERKDD